MDRGKAQGIENLMGRFREKMPLVVIALICLAAGLGFYSYLSRRAAERDITASIFIEEGKRLFREADFGSAAERFEALAKEYGGSVHAQEAGLYRVRIFTEMGEYEKARALAEEYLLNYPDGKYLPELHYELGFILEQQGGYRKAALQYGLLSRNFPGHYLAPQSLLDKARCMEELGEWAEAEKIYAFLMEAYPWSASAEAALAYREAIWPRLENQR